MEKIVGVAGLGIMGGAIAANLRERGWTVYGFDVVAARGEEAQAAGVELCASLGALSEKAPLILTSLPSANAAADVAAAIAASGTSRRVVVEMSTLGLDDKLAFARALETAGACGARLSFERHGLSGATTRPCRLCERRHGDS